MVFTTVNENVAGGGGPGGGGPGGGPGGGVGPVQSASTLHWLGPLSFGSQPHCFVLKHLNRPLLLHACWLQL